MFDFSRFLGRCPRLSHYAALRQTATIKQSLMTEQTQVNSATPTAPTFAHASPTVRDSASLCTTCISFVYGQVAECLTAPVLPSQYPSYNSVEDEYELLDPWFHPQIEVPDEEQLQTVCG